MLNPVKSMISSDATNVSINELVILPSKPDLLYFTLHSKQFSEGVAASNRIHLKMV